MGHSDRIMGVGEGRVGASVVELTVSCARVMALLDISVSYLVFGDRGGTMVKVLCYKSEGRWFDSR
jgi:hypothetical protein